MELRALMIDLEAPVDDISPRLLQWTDPFRERLGDFSIESEWGAKGLETRSENSWLSLVEREEETGRQDLEEPLSVAPLAVVEPMEPPTPLVEETQPSEWSLQKHRACGKVLGASFKGHEDEVMALIMSINARRKRPLVNNSQEKVNGFGVKGSRELKGLVSSVNYEVKSRALSVIP
jgi:hypothetical protein